MANAPIDTSGFARRAKQAEESLADLLKHLRCVFNCVGEWLGLQRLGQAFGVRVTTPAIDIDLQIMSLYVTDARRIPYSLTFDMPFLMHSLNSSSGSSSVPCKQSGILPLNVCCRSFKLHEPSVQQRECPGRVTLTYPVGNSAG